MTKQQFLEELKQALSGEVSSEAMMDAYSYYSNYIDEQMRSGKTETQVIVYAKRIKMSSTNFNFFKFFSIHLFSKSYRFKKYMIK